MKKLFLAMFAAIMCGMTVCAQSYEDIRQEREIIRKMSKSELNEKASKSAKKEAKKLVKEGWLAAPGALPIEKQLDRSYMMQMEYDEDMFPKYIMGEAMSVSNNYDAAKIQATTLAKQNIAEKIQSEVAALITSEGANEQISEDEINSFVKTVYASKQLISQNIGRVIDVIEIYRIVPGKKKEVRIMIAYNSDMAKRAAKKTIIENLKDESATLKDSLDKLLGK
ncbi:hypothetical protein [uncultured Duncaniella sp.]|uniref:hypothetical protein n=1 Tax=uncultured Duncaniella sp. TaxID=2768039 RepID=UPI002675A09A|nr:hypothetical protein [uncultured Duncaniella sp.]MCI9172745.1 hypothetical protein [Muribaculaceae bacterium]